VSREDIAKGQIKLLKKTIERILTSAPYPMEKRTFLKYVSKRFEKVCREVCGCSSFFYGIPSDGYVIEERELLRDGHSVVYCELDVWLPFRCGKLTLYRKAVVSLLEVNHLDIVLGVTLKIR
jgi:hypothetical protein